MRTHSVTDRPVHQCALQSVELRIDPGSRVTGLSVVAQFKRGLVVLWAANLHHRGLLIKERLDKRRAIRRGRRNRKTRYRSARFLNRTRPKGWLPPSLLSRVNNVKHWAHKLSKIVPVSQIAIETVRFDTQKMETPEISGVEYQQGELFGYEIREYLLEKWGRKCVYCGAENVPLQIEHISPKARGGTNRVSNLTLACQSCNQAKGKRSIQEFLAHAPAKLKQIQAQTKQSLKDATAVNAIRYATGNVLKSLGLPITFWSGGRTKYNRVKQGYAKDHWIDASCMGELGSDVIIHPSLKALIIKAMGRGNRQVCQTDKYGFPRSKPRQGKRIHGFQTGDMVSAIVPKGKSAGFHVGRVTVRASGSFRIGSVNHINWKYCTLLQRADGYSYE
jgi:5-methylcytosine-specific restriction endonuclease McrA